MRPYVLDSSAILTVLFNEPGAVRVLEILEAGKPFSSSDETMVSLPFIALMEIEYWLLRRFSAAEAQRILLLVENWPIRIEESTAAWRHEAARVKATTPLSVADSWIAALALTQGATLVHKDPEYDQIATLLVERLPYKARQT